MIESDRIRKGSANYENDYSERDIQKTRRVL